MDKIIESFKNFPQVKAIAIGGSSSAKTNDKSSDIDIYVFVEKDIPVIERENIIKNFSEKYEVGAEYFGAGDEFLDKETNTVFDMMYWNTKWFEDIVDNVWVKHYPSNGYTTCFLYTLDICKIVYDPTGWLQGLKDKINTEYPEELQKNIIHRNMMLLKDKPFASYYEQIAKALARGDLNSVNHRIAAFLASYFDIIFAKNKLLHPGEKRLIQYAQKHCKILPQYFEENINALITNPHLENLDNIIDNLRNIILKY